MPDALAGFRNALIAFYLEEAARVAEAATALTVIASRLSAPALEKGRPHRKQLPALALLPTAIEEASLGPLTSLATAFAALEPEAAWVQNPNYNDAKMGAGYMANYAYCVIAEPDGLLKAEDILVSLLLIGPKRLYPAHAHEAEEVYHLLAGPSHWWREGEDWQTRSPGALVHHRPWRTHATKTGKSSLLAIASWYGNPLKAANLVAGSYLPAIPT